MRDPSNWTEADLQALVDDKVQEDLHLDYKRSAALAKTDPCRMELSKDVSAFANSDGGLIIYGIAEGKDNYPAEIDEGIDAIVLNREWLEQTVTSYIQPKIDELRIFQISLPSKGQNRIAYVISIPQAKTRAPHQARDKKYYRRYNFQSVPMEDYEIRDIFRRTSTPDLYMDFVFDTGVTTTIPTPGQIRLNARIGNRSREPALYAAITVYVDHLFTITYGEGLSQNRIVETSDRRKLRILEKNWCVPSQLPIFSEVLLRITNQPIVLSLDETALRWPDFYLGYDIRAPGFSAFKIVRVLHQSETLWISV